MSTDQSTDQRTTSLNEVDGEYIINRKNLFLKFDEGEKSKESCYFEWVNDRRNASLFTEEEGLHMIDKNNMVSTRLVSIRTALPLELDKKFKANEMKILKLREELTDMKIVEHNLFVTGRREEARVFRETMTHPKEKSILPYDQISVDLRKNRVWPEDKIPCKGFNVWYPSICLLGQFHGYDVVQDLVPYIEVLHETGYRLDIYLTMIRDEDINNFHRTYRTASWYSSVKWVKLWTNRGMDVGAFLWQCREIENLASYDLMIKMHTKTDPVWRRNMLDPICKDVDRVKHVIQIMSDQEIGLVGSRRNLYNNYDYISGKHTYEVERECFHRYMITDERAFIAGTIFWIKPALMVGLLKETSKYVDQCCNESPVGDRQVPYPYTYERLFGYYTVLRGYQIGCVQ